VIVIDASVLVTVLTDDSGAGRRLAGELAGDEAAAPHLLDCEVVSAILRLRRQGNLSETRARQALADLGRFPVERFPHAGLVERMWQLGGSITAYDAAYVALGEALAAPLLTCDAKLSRAQGHECEIRLVI
jgi:predicted nucleic acid-binding protein